MLVQSKDLAGTGGADPVTDVEKAALAVGEQVIKSPPIPKPRFHPIEAFGFGDVEGGKGGRPLQRGITFREVQTAHDDQPRTEGRAYLYFWPGGLTERAEIQLRIGDERQRFVVLGSVRLDLRVALHDLDHAPPMRLQNLLDIDPRDLQGDQHLDHELIARRRDELRWRAQPAGQLFRTG